ncbi:hypothetical protein C1H46_029295, partial [Malus baccata]
ISQTKDTTSFVLTSQANNTQPRLQHPSRSSGSKLGTFMTSRPFVDEFQKLRQVFSYQPASNRGARTPPLYSPRETSEFSAFRLGPARIGRPAQIGYVSVLDRTGRLDRRLDRVGLVEPVGSEVVPDEPGRTGSDRMDQVEAAEPGRTFARPAESSQG